MMILKLLARENFITYNKVIADVVGVSCALVLGEICSLSNIFKDKEFYFTYDQIAKETKLTEYAVKKAVNDLLETGVLNTTRKGVPCRNWYTINEKVIERMLEGDYSRTSPYEFGGTSGSELEGTSGIEFEGTFKKRYEKKNMTNKDMRELFSDEKNSPQDTQEYPGSLDEVKQFCREKGLEIDAEFFYNYHEATGWEGVKNWKGLIIILDRRMCKRGKK